MNRITVRLDDDLYHRLLLFAKLRSDEQSPEISPIVREALEQYMTPCNVTPQKPHMRKKHRGHT